MNLDLLAIGAHVQLTLCDFELCGVPVHDRPGYWVRGLVAIIPQGWRT